MSQDYKLITDFLYKCDPKKDLKIIIISTKDRFKQICTELINKFFKNECIQCHSDTNLYIKDGQSIRFLLLWPEYKSCRGFNADIIFTDISKEDEGYENIWKDIVIPLLVSGTSIVSLD